MTRDEEALNPHSMFALYRRFLQAGTSAVAASPISNGFPLSKRTLSHSTTGLRLCDEHRATAIPFGRIGGLGAVIARSDHSERDLIEGDSTVWFERLPTEGMISLHYR